MALSGNAAENIGETGAGLRAPPASPDRDWAWARIFSSFEQRPAVFTNAHLPDNPIEYATPAFCALTGYTADEVVGRNCRLLQGPDTDPEAVAAIRRAIAECLPVTVDILNYRKDGTPFWNRLCIRPVFGRGNVVQRFIGAQSPIDAADRRPGAYTSFAVTA